MNPLIQFGKSSALTLIVLLACFAQKAQAGSPAPAGSPAKGKSPEAANAVTKGHANVPSPVPAFPIWNPCNTGTGTGALPSNPTGWDNTADGCHALSNDTTGGSNTATGAYALFNNTTGEINTATGLQALYSNTSGQWNTATGAYALLGNTTGYENVAIGVNALYRNTNGAFNTASGDSALALNTSGGDNTAIGDGALGNNTTSIGNTASGESALLSNTTGDRNTATGLNALWHNTTGANNTAIGLAAGFNQTTGSNNVYIGASMYGVAGESNACYVASIDGQTSGSGVAVLINSSGKLGTTTSSRRFKEGIKPMDNTSEALFALKPVTFRYKKELDPQGIQQWGLVAEDVQKVNTALVALDRQGRPYAVRYDQVNAMLLNEFLKEHKAFVEQQHNAEKLQATVANLVTTVKEQAAQIQKVNAELELTKRVPQVVNNP